MRLIKSYSANVQVISLAHSSLYKGDTAWDTETLEIRQDGTSVVLGDKMKISKALIEDLYKEFCQ